MYRNVLKNHFLNGQNSPENVSNSWKLSWQMLLWILWNGQKIDSKLQTQLSTQTLDPTFFGHAKFEVKIFSLYLVLWTLFPQVGGGGGGGGECLGPNFFLVMPNLRSKIFPLFSTLDSISAGGGGGGGVWGGGGSRTQLFVVMPNLRSKIFPFI